MLRDLSFDAPTRLWVLAALAVAATVLLVLRRRTGSAYAAPALMASVRPHRMGWRRPAALAGLVLAVVSLTTAFAEPSVRTQEAHERAVVVVALDTSASMLATDVAPDRFTAAKAAAQAFVRDLPEQVEVGLVSFNATATLVAPPTDDHERVAAAVDDLELTGGTAAGDALQLSLDAVLARLATAPAGQSGAAAPPARIVVLADGDSTTGATLEQASAVVADAGVPVTTIAYGTADGVVVAGGVTYDVPVDTEALARVAETTGGTAYTAASAGQLREVYDDIGAVLVADSSREDVADLFAGLGVVLLLGTAVPSLALTSRLA